MKHLLAAVLVLGLGACSSLPNIITNNTEATAESTYISAATVESAYLHLSWCATGVHFAITAPCKESPVVAEVKQADNVAYAAIKQMRAFKVANPGSTASLTAYINAAISAAQALQSVIPLKAT